MAIVAIRHHRGACGQWASTVNSAACSGVSNGAGRPTSARHPAGQGHLPLLQPGRCRVLHHPRRRTDHQRPYRVARRRVEARETDRCRQRRVSRPQRHQRVDSGAAVGADHAVHKAYVPVGADHHSAVQQRPQPLVLPHPLRHRRQFLGDAVVRSHSMPALPNRAVAKRKPSAEVRPVMCASARPGARPGIPAGPAPRSSAGSPAAPADRWCPRSRPGPRGRMPRSIRPPPDAQLSISTAGKSRAQSREQPVERRGLPVGRPRACSRSRLWSHFKKAIAYDVSSALDRSSTYA